MKPLSLLSQTSTVTPGWQPQVETPASESFPATILLVEGDDQVRGFIRAILAGDGHRILEARSGQEARDLADRHGGDINLLLADTEVPALNSFQLAGSLQLRHPRMQVLFIAGYVDQDLLSRNIPGFCATFLDKPFPPSLLRKRVRECLTPVQYAYRAAY